MNMNFFDWAAHFLRPRRAAPRAKQPITRRPLRTYRAAGVTVQALTRSEARAELKRRLGFKGRLPPGFVAEEVR